MRRSFIIALALSAVASAAFAQAQGRPGVPAPPSETPRLRITQAEPANAARGKSFAVVGAKIVTNGPAGVIDGGVVLIRDGRVAAVGKDVVIPAGVERIDAAGKWVTPALVSPFSRLGLMAIELENDANDASVRDTPVAAAADASDAFDPAAAPIAVTRVEGVLRAAVAPHGGPSPIAGYGALVDLSGGPASVTRARAFVYVEAGDAGVARAGHSRMTLWPYLDAAFSDARAYPMRFMTHPDGSVLRRGEAEALVPVVRGEIPMLVRVDRASDIRQALAFRARQPGLKMVLVGVSEGWLAADAIAAAKVPVIVDPFRNLPASFDSLGARLDNAALLRKAGVTVAIGPSPGSDEGHQVRLAPQLAGNAVANGLSWADGFAAISAVPAEIFGLDGIGRLTPGSIGDVIVWDGDPLEVSSSPDRVWIAGADTPLSSRQTLLRDRYLKLDQAVERPFQYR